MEAEAEAPGAPDSRHEGGGERVVPCGKRMGGLKFEMVETLAVEGGKVQTCGAGARDRSLRVRPTVKIVLHSLKIAITFFFSKIDDVTLTVE